MWEKNKNLRGENEQIEYTKEMIDEYIKCKEDIIYFAENFVFINTIDYGRVKIALYEFQKKILKVIMCPPDSRSGVIMNIPRQSGKCIFENSKIKIRNKKTGEIKEIVIKDFFETHNNIINDVNIIKNKIIKSKLVNEWEILTDDGYVDITQVHKTIKYSVWKLKTKSFSLKCADEHLVVKDTYETVYVKDLKIGDKIITENGIENILYVKKLKCKSKNMYDVTVNSKKHLFYSNGILSHNTTTMMVYLLHYILFNKEKNVAILANKEKTALKILRELKMSYENLPMWLQVGVKQDGWNKESLLLENGNRVIAATTSNDSISGEAISLLYLDEFAKVKEHIAEEFITATMPVLSSGKSSKVIISSTPVGMNHYYDYWIGAVRNTNNFYPIKVNWQDHPKRDEEWKKKVIRDFNGDVNRFNQEYGCFKNGTVIIRNKLTKNIKKIKIEKLYKDLSRG
jgi:hypothetical protein